MDLLTRIDGATQRFLRVVALVGFSVMVAEAAIVTMDALLRSFVNAPIRGLGEVIDITTATVIATCIPAVVAQRRNISVKLLSGALGERGRLVVEVVSHLFLLAFVAVVSLQLIAHAIDVASIGERTLVRKIPLAPFWMTAAIIVALSVPAQMVVTAVSVARLLSPRVAWGDKQN